MSRLSSSAPAGGDPGQNQDSCYKKIGDLARITTPTPGG